MHNLMKKYMEPHRYYHNFNHIARMFYIAKRNKIELTNEQTLAIFFHDVIYVPGRSDNEVKSAEYFYDWCYYNHNVDGIDGEIVGRIILDTKTELPSIEQSKIVIDLDLYDLGTLLYATNSELIRKEFLTVYNEQQYISGRKNWIEGFLERDSIYVSDLGIPLEQVARQNLIGELNEEIYCN